LNQATNSTVRGLQLDQHRLQFERIANWLSPTNFAAQQVDIISRRVNQTGQWFLESDKFNDWLHGKNTTLFCPGIPGAGKTMLAAITIDYLAKMEASERTGLTYLYCNYKSQRDINASTLLGAILKQLVQSQPTIDEQISSLYEQYTRFGTKPSFQKLSTALKAVLKKFLTVYVVIDALDECPSRDGICNQLLAELRHLQRETDLRLMATSRHIPEIENEFRSMSMVEIRATNADVSQYVRDQIHRLPRCIRRDSSLQEQVVNQVSEAVDGMSVNCFHLFRLFLHI
jgi:hypothetical protein